MLCQPFPHNLYTFEGASQVSVIRNLSAKQEMWVPSLSQENPLEKKWQHTPVLLAGEFHRQRNLAGYSQWSHRVAHDWATFTFTLLPWPERKLPFVVLQVETDLEGKIQEMPGTCSRTRKWEEWGTSIWEQPSGTEVEARGKSHQPGRTQQQKNYRGAWDLKCLKEPS